MLKNAAGFVSKPLFGYSQFVSFCCRVNVVFHWTRDVHLTWGEIRAKPEIREVFRFLRFVSNRAAPHCHINKEHVFQSSRKSFLINLETLVFFFKKKINKQRQAFNSTKKGFYINREHDGFLMIIKLVRSFLLDCCEACSSQEHTITRITKSHEKLMCLQTHA